MNSDYVTLRVKIDRVFVQDERDLYFAARAIVLSRFKPSFDQLTSRAANEIRINGYGLIFENQTLRIRGNWGLTNYGLQFKVEDFDVLPY